MKRNHFREKGWRGEEGKIKKARRRENRKKCERESMTRELVSLTKLNKHSIVDVYMGL